MQIKNFLKPQPSFWTTFVVLALLSSMSSQAAYNYDARRGHPADYDPGPAKNSNWTRLFAENPNYRALGMKIFGESKFRWQFGPMWYRGRLGENQVKVFVVGQEGAQDENVSNRAFTGSTGTKTQKFLNHLGIYESYLFLNTFTYTINGQLVPGDKNFEWMEQGIDPDQANLPSDEPGIGSPIVEYRNTLFNEMARTNSKTLSLIIGVGSGGKASVATWVNANGGKCSPDSNLTKCDLSAVEKKYGIPAGQLLAVGVPHPGGASPKNGGADALNNIIRGFTNAAKRVAAKKLNDKSWLPGDRNPSNGRADEEKEVVARLNQTYRYADAPIPFRDFAFGTNWRMGDKGTTSNRQGANAIQVFSAAGKYNGEGQDPQYGKNPDDKGPRPQLPQGDLAYESPKYFKDRSVNLHQLFDHGPCKPELYSGYNSGSVNQRDAQSGSIACPMAIALHNWGFEGLAAGTSHESFGYGPAYRGNPYNAQVLIVADQESHDDFFSGRAWTGLKGQELQGLLNSLNAGGKYLIVRTLPVDTLGNPNAEKLALSAAANNAREKIFSLVLAEGKTRAVVTIGDQARQAVAASQSLRAIRNKVELTLKPDWEDAAAQIARAAGFTKKSGAVKAATIAREDLPVHSRWWMGGTGDRAVRAERFAAGLNLSGSYYKFFAPHWVTKLPQKDLSAAEAADIDRRLQENGLRGRSADGDAIADYLRLGGDEGDFIIAKDKTGKDIIIRLSEQDVYSDFDFDKLWSSVESELKISGRSSDTVKEDDLLEIVRDQYDDSVLSKAAAQSEADLDGK